VDLSRGHRRIEPVERLRDEQGIGARIRQRNRLGRPREHVRGGGGADELRAHAGHRLDRDHVRAGWGQAAGQLPGSGRKVDDRLPGAESKFGGE
jgi:hypothetical protein